MIFRSIKINLAKEKVLLDLGALKYYFDSYNKEVCKHYAKKMRKISMLARGIFIM